MARVTYGALVSGISGSVGSSTFQKSLYGNTLRNKPRNRKSGSESQMVCRTLMMQCHQAWALLTDAQRRQWNQYVSFSGVSCNRDRGVLLTGHALFLKYNLLRLINYQAILTDPTYITMPAWPLFSALRADGDTLYVECSADWGIFDLACVFKVSAPRNPSLSFSPAGLRVMRNSVFEDTFLELDTQYPAAFGVWPVVGSTVHYAIQYYSMLAPVMSGVYTGITVILS